MIKLIDDPLWSTFKQWPRGVKKLVLQLSFNSIHDQLSWVMMWAERWCHTYRWWGVRCWWRWVSRCRCSQTLRSAPASWSPPTRAGTAATGKMVSFYAKSCKLIHDHFFLAIFSDRRSVMRPKTRRKLWNFEMPKIDRWLPHERSGWLCTIAI